jgi:hypothetical protein
MLQIRLQASMNLANSEYCKVGDQELPDCAKPFHKARVYQLRRSSTFKTSTRNPGFPTARYCPPSRQSGQYLP